jgi:hypothetical protein
MRPSTLAPLIGLLAAVACTNDYGTLDFSGGLVGTPDAGTGGSSAAGGSGGTAMGGGGTGGSATGASGGTAGASAAGGVDGGAGTAGTSGGGTAGGGGADASAGGTGGATGGTGGTSGDASVDGAALDGATTDGSASDAAASDAADGGPSCDSIYGGVTGYELCAETATTCTFAVEANYAPCTAVCANFGRACLDAADNDANTALCVVTDPAPDCNTTTLFTQICTCDR